MCYVYESGDCVCGMCMRVGIVCVCYVYESGDCVCVMCVRGGIVCVLCV